MNAISKQSDTQVSRPILSPQTFDQLLKFSEFAASSDLMPRDYKGKPANIFLAVQMGSELGLAPMQALQSIAVINGKPGVYGDGMIGLCRQSPLCEDIRETIEGEGDNRTATCEAKRRGSTAVVAKFSVADAKKAGLWSKAGPWTQYPDRMLQNRARGFALRDAFPDLLRGLTTVEELRDYPPDPKPEPRPVQSVQSKPSPPALEPASLRDMRPVPSRAEIDKILENDQIPALEEDPSLMLDKPVDKAAVGVTALEARVRACTTEDELHAITGDAKVAKQRAWLAENRPELDARLADALGQRYDEIVAARQEAEAEGNEAMA